MIVLLGYFKNDCYLTASLSYNSSVGFYISNYNIKDTKGKTLISKSEVYNLLPANLGGYFVRCPSSKTDSSYSPNYIYSIPVNLYEYNSLGICFGYHGSYNYQLFYSNNTFERNGSSLILNDVTDFNNKLIFPYGSQNATTSANWSPASYPFSLATCYFNSCDNYQLYFHIIGGKFNTEPTDDETDTGGTGNTEIEYTGEDYVLNLVDQNLRKRFVFNFHIPKVREDTKFYCFLDYYDRLSYDMVTADFTIYTVTTPERL